MDKPNTVSAFGIEQTCIRKTANEELMMRLTERAGEFLLPWAPKQGSTRILYPGDRILYETGLKLSIHHGDIGIATLAYRGANGGQPGLSLFGAIIDSRMKDHELVIPFCNNTPWEIKLFPGDYAAHLIILGRKKTAQFVDSMPAATSPTATAATGKK